jgi:hypothetical protein
MTHSNTTPTPTLPSIRNRALLVSLNFSNPQKTKTDAKATRDAETAAGAAGAGRYVLNLYPKHLLDPISQHESAVRNYLRSKTLPWGDTGTCLLDTTKFMEVADRLAQYEVERKQLVTVFAQNWSNVLSQAAQQQGSLFDPSVYPDVSDVVAQFQMRVSYLPVGDMANNLFDSIEAELKEAITDAVAQSTTALANQLAAEPIERLLKAVLNVYDKTARDNSRVHPSLMTALDDIIEQLPAFNPLSIPAITTLGERAKALRAHPDVVADKESEARKRISVDAKTLLEDVGIDPTQVLAATATERASLATAAAQSIVDAMKGF